MARYESDKKRSKIRISEAIEKHRHEYEEKKKQCPFDAVRQEDFETKKYGKRVQERRNLLNKTQRDIAKEAGMTTAMLSKIEAGKIKVINQDYLYLLSVALNCTPDYLLGKTNEPEEFIVVSQNKEAKDNNQTAISPFNKYEKPVSDLYLFIMQGVTLAAAQKMYDAIPETVFQLIAILRSENPKLISEFSKCVDLLCSSYSVEVEHFRRSSN